MKGTTHSSKIDPPHEAVYDIRRKTFHPDLPQGRSFDMGGSEHDHLDAVQLNRKNRKEDIKPNDRYV